MGNVWERSPNDQEMCGPWGVEEDKVNHNFNLKKPNQTNTCTHKYKKLAMKHKTP